MKKKLKRYMCILISFLIVVTLYFKPSFANQEVRSPNTQYVIINSKTNKLAYFNNGSLVKEFPVATGKSATQTPTGKFKIVNKIKNRPYYKLGIPGGSPKNPLGDRWMGLAVGLTFGSTYGIHGNNNESSIGKHVSGGCIRMHNVDARWLFDKINVGAYAIIDNSNLSFTQIAAKYGVTLNSDNNTVSQNIRNLQNEFTKFAKYQNRVDLLNTNSIITSLEDANGILASKQGYLNTYNKLTNTEKNNSEVVKINSQFIKISSIAEFAQGTYEFFNNVNANANDIINNVTLAEQLNSFEGEDFGTRGKAFKEYSEAISFGEDKMKSNRIAYLDKVYFDVVNFLSVPQYVASKDIENATLTANKINDINLKNIALKAIESISDIESN